MTRIFVVRQTVQSIDCTHNYEYWSNFRNRFVLWGKHDEFDSRRAANRKIEEIGAGQAIEIT